MTLPHTVVMLGPGACIVHQDDGGSYVADDVFDWLEAHVGHSYDEREDGVWSCEVAFTDRWSYTFSFLDPQKAMLFRLTWSAI